MELAEPRRIDLSAIAEAAPPLRLGAPSGAARELFQQHGDLDYAAILDGLDRPAGLMARAALEASDASPGEPVDGVMDAEPLVLDVASNLEMLSAAIREMTPEKLATGFVVVAEGVYRGVGSSAALMRIVADHLLDQTLELEAARREAETAAIAKDRFFATMTHELRTPLNGIIGFGQLLAAEAHGELGSEEYKLYAKDIVDSGNHLVSIIGDILDLAKIEAGRVELHERLVNLWELTGRALRMIGPIAAKKNIALHTSAVERDLIESSVRALVQPRARTYGKVDASVVRQKIHRDLPKINRCFESALRYEPELAGKVKVRFAVVRKGHVEGVRVLENTTGHAGVERCVARVVSGIKFPIRRYGKPLSFTFPFIFAPQ